MNTNAFKGKNGPLLIAEIGGNHEGSFEYAKRLTELAINTDVDYIKFQIYSGDSLVSSVENPKRNEHFKKFQLSKNEHIQLAKMVKNSGKGYMASVWDISSLDWIDEFISIYKIGSGDLTSYPILKETAQIGKPIILSTGLSHEEEVLDSISFIQNIDKKYCRSNMLAILQCTSMYPINPSDSNLLVMSRMKELTNLTVGYSDHNIGTKALKYAYLLGAEVLEFHFTDDRTNKYFRDHKVSLTPKEVGALIGEINLINDILGSPQKKPLKIEIENDHIVSFRRGVYPSRDISANEILSDKNLTILRPAKGIDARDYYEVIGMKVKKDFKYHECLDWENLEKL